MVKAGVSKTPSKGGSNPSTSTITGPSIGPYKTKQIVKRHTLDLLVNRDFFDNLPPKEVWVYSLPYDRSMPKSHEHFGMEKLSDFVKQLIEGPADVTAAYYAPWDELVRGYMKWSTGMIRTLRYMKQDDLDAEMDVIADAIGELLRNPITIPAGIPMSGFGRNTIQLKNIMNKFVNDRGIPVIEGTQKSVVIDGMTCKSSTDRRHPVWTMLLTAIVRRMTVGYVSWHIIRRNGKIEVTHKSARSIFISPLNNTAMTAMADLGPSSPWWTGPLGGFQYPMLYKWVMSNNPPPLSLWIDIANAIRHPAFRKMIYEHVMARNHAMAEQLVDWQKTLIIRKKIFGMAHSHWIMERMKNGNGHRE